MRELRSLRDGYPQVRVKCGGCDVVLDTLAVDGTRLARIPQIGSTGAQIEHLPDPTRYKCPRCGSDLRVPLVQLAGPAIKAAGQRRKSGRVVRISETPVGLYVA